MLYLFIRCMVFFQVHGWFLSKFLSLIIILFHVVFTSLFIRISSFLSTFTWGLTATFFLFFLNREILKKTKEYAIIFVFFPTSHLLSSAMMLLAYMCHTLHLHPIGARGRGYDRHTWAMMLLAVKTTLCSSNCSL